MHKIKKKKLQEIIYLASWMIEMCYLVTVAAQLYLAYELQYPK